MSLWNSSVSDTQIKFKNRIWLYVFALVVLFLLIVPSLVVVPMSFSDSQYLEFPPKNYSTRWYENYFYSIDWLQATWTSVKVGVLTIFVATPLGIMAAYGLVNSNAKMRNILFPIMISPMMVPVILVAIGLFYFFLQFWMLSLVIVL